MFIVKRAHLSFCLQAVSWYRLPISDPWLFLFCLLYGFLICFLFILSALFNQLKTVHNIPNSSAHLCFEKLMPYASSAIDTERSLLNMKFKDQFPLWMANENQEVCNRRTNGIDCYYENKYRCLFLITMGKMLYTYFGYWMMQVN